MSRAIRCMQRNWLSNVYLWSWGSWLKDLRSCAKCFTKWSHHYLCPHCRYRCDSLALEPSLSSMLLRVQIGKSKKSAWEAWKSYPEVTEAFLCAADRPFEILKLSSRVTKLLEQYICVLYDKTTPTCFVHELRQELFCKRAKMMENIPPTQVCSHLYLCYLYYINLLFFFFLQEQQNRPQPEGFGWTRDDNSLWKPVWTLLPEVAKASRELLKCGCKAKPLCSKRCRCEGAGLSCAALCLCGENCD